MEQNPLVVDGRTSSPSSVASPSTEAEGETSSMCDVAEQKPVLAVGVSSPVSSGEHHKPTVEEDRTVSASGDVQQIPAVVAGGSLPASSFAQQKREVLEDGKLTKGCETGFVCCMATADRSEAMNRSLQKYNIHLERSHPLSTTNRTKRCAWCSLRDIRAACNMNFRSGGEPRCDRSCSENVSKENM
ncbi:hypothetical protein DAI22_02g187100 [Oryza sativa Japonica Group]|nr:uncharacterized protein LOC107277029 [Oryza sativa Japonica Group]KAF2945030.1 hypothetical protein DAI22_02g187100 [Oryza sativa Japonica Group]